MTAPARHPSTAPGATGGKMVAGLPDTSMFGPHRHRHVHQVFGHSDAAHLAEQAYNTMRRQDGRIRWQDIDITNPMHVSFRDEAIREGERQKRVTKDHRRAKNKAKAEAEAALLRAMQAEGKRCGNCNCGSEPPSQMVLRSRAGQLVCDLYSDFHGYVLVEPGDICKRWSRPHRRPLSPPPRPGRRYGGGADVSETLSNEQLVDGLIQIVCDELGADAGILGKWAKNCRAQILARMSPGWQPIETAPKDGTVVDIMTADGHRIADVQWLTGAQRDPETCGPGKPWERLANDGWDHVGSKSGTRRLVDDKFAWWMLAPALPPPSDIETYHAP